MSVDLGRVEKLRTPAEAAGLIRPGWTLMVGGFGLSGCPLAVLEALAERDDLRDLTVISNNLGEPGLGLGTLLLQGKIRKAIGSFFTSNPDVGAAYLAGRLEIELIPQGSMSEAIRAGGAGIPAFYTPTAAGTKLAEGREQREIDGRLCLLQPALRADAALVRAAVADELGNLVYRASMRNFNPMMASAADLVIAEVDEIVPTGAISPDHVVTPHLYVDLLVLRPWPEGADGDR